MLLALALRGCTRPMAVVPAAPRWAPDSATVRVAPGPHYWRTAWWRFWWGRHYRAEWATPVTVPVLRLATAVPGGLMPRRMGGSYQSTTLRLVARDGHEFVLRSVDKDMSAALPTGWVRRLLGGLMKDQTSASLPYGAYIAAPAAEAVGVLHANPRLMYLPDDPALGPFRARFANALYLLEERPDRDQRGRASFGNSPDVVNSARMLTQIRRRPRAQVPPRAYLRARLLDMWLGDWSRREDQWRWASFPEAGRTLYRPIPRDRDQAFFLFDDGVSTRLLSWCLPKFQSFHATIRPANVDALTTTARTLDRTLLAPLSAEDFRQEADSLRLLLSDEVIMHALATGPAETRGLVAARLAPLLRARRASLPAVARRYFEILAREAWVVGTDRAERFVVSGVGPGQVRVRLLARRPGQPDSLLSQRTYDRQYTRAINLYGLGGNDVFVLEPPLRSGIALNLYDGTGTDQVVNRARFSADIGDVTWFTRPAARLPANGSVHTEPDPHPELSTDGAAWLRRYRLRD